MLRVKQDTISSLEESIQRSIDYESISPSILLFLEVRDVSIASFTPVGRQNVSIGKIRIYYDFGRLLKGDIASAIEEIRVLNSNFNIDQLRDRQLLSKIQSLLTGEQGGGSRNGQELNLPENLKISGKNIDLEYNTEQEYHKLLDVSFQIDFRQDEINFEMRGNGTTDFSPGFQIADLSLQKLSTDIELRGSYYQKEKEFSARLTLEDFESNLLHFTGLTLDIAQSPDSISLRKIEDRSPYDFLFTYYLESGRLESRLVAEEFVPGDNISPQKDLYPYSQWLNSSLSGDVTLQYNPAYQNLSYQGELKLSADNRFLPFPIEIAAKGGGTEKYTIFDDLSFNSSKAAGQFRGRVQYNELFATGALSIRYLQLSEDHTASGSFSIAGSRDDFRINSPRLAINSILVRDISVSGALLRNEANFTLDAFYTAADAADDAADVREDANISADGAVRFGEEPFFEISMSAESVPLTGIALETIPEEMKPYLPERELFLSTKAYINTNFEKFSFSFLPIDIQDSKGKNIAGGSVNGNNERLRIDNIAYTSEKIDVGGELELLKTGEKNYRFQSSFSVNSIYYEFEGMYTQANALVIRGNHGLSLTTIFQPELYAFSGQFEDLPLPYDRENVGSLSFKGRGRFRNSSSWSLQVQDMQAQGIPGLPDNNSLELSGTFQPDRFSVQEIRYSDNISSLFGNGEAAYRSLSPLEGDTQFRLESENSDELYQVVGSRYGEQVNANILLRSVPVSRVPDLPLNGRLSGSMNIGGTLSEPELDYSISLENGEYRQSPISFEMVGDYGNRLHQLTYLHAEYKSHIIQRGEARLNLTSGEAELVGQYRGIYLQKQASTDFRMTASIQAETIVLSPANLRAPDFTARLDLSNIQIFGDTQEDWQLSLEHQKGELSFRGGPDDALDGRIAQNGRFSFSLSEPLPLHLKVNGITSEDEFGISVNDILIQSEFLNLVDLKVLTFLSGIIQGDLNISGQPNDPLFNGEFSVTDFSGRVKYVNDTIKPFSTRMVIKDNIAQLTPVEVQVREGRAVLSGGFSFERWNVDSIDVIVDVSQEKPVPVLFTNPSSGLTIDGYAYGDFYYAMQPEMDVIGGNLVAQNCVIALEDRQEAPIRSGGVEPIEVDLNIKTGRRVEFLWPRRNLPILQAFADTGDTLHVGYNGISEEFELRGEVGLKSGELYYFQRSFYIKEGTITFNENEDKFDPLLQVDAQIKEVDNSGRPITISFIVDSEPLSSFTPRFESTPPISTVEIASLLGTNLNTQFSQGPGELTTALMITGDLFSQFSILRSFERQMKDIFNLDLFSIRTQMIQNVILERVLNQNITQDPEASGSVGQYLDNTTLFLGKYLGNDLFLEALVQIQQEPIETGDFVEDELDLTMEVGLEWKTPFFLLNFSLSPDFEDPMNSIDNTSLGFSWDFSY